MKMRWKEEAGCRVYGKRKCQFMKGKHLCFGNDSAYVWNQIYLDSKAWNDVLLLSDMVGREKINQEERNPKNGWEKTPTKYNVLKTEATWQRASRCQSRKRLKMDYTYNRMKPDRRKAYQGPPPTQTDGRTGSLCRTYMITFGPGEGCRVTQRWGLRSAVANLRLRWAWWWRQRGRWRLHKH